MALQHHTHWGVPGRRCWCNMSLCGQTHVCALRGFSTRRGGARKAEQPYSPSPAVQCRVCAPQFCRLHTFSWTLISAAGKKGPLRHQVTPSLDAAPGQAEKFSHLHQHSCPLCVPGTPSIGSWHQDTTPISLTILRHPQKGLLR